MRYVPPTRYERQLYYHLLHRMEELKTLPAVASLTLIEKQSKPEIWLNIDELLNMSKVAKCI